MSTAEKMVDAALASVAVVVAAERCATRMAEYMNSYRDDRRRVDQMHSSTLVPWLETKAKPKVRRCETLKTAFTGSYTVQV